MEETDKEVTMTTESPRTRGQAVPSYRINTMRGTWGQPSGWNGENHGICLETVFTKKVPWTPQPSHLWRREIESMTMQE